MNNTTSKKSSNFQQALWLGIGQFCTFAISFISAAILSRILDKTEYGTYKQILYIYVTLQSLFTAGLPSVFSYFIPRLEVGQQKKLISSLNRIFLIIGTILSIILFAGSSLIADILKNPELSIGLKLFSPFPLFTLPTMGVEGIYTAIRETKKLAKYHIFSKAIMLVGIVLPVVLLGAKYEYAIIGWGAASFAIFIVAMYMKNRPYVSIKKMEIPNMYKSIFSYSTPLIGAFIGGFAISLADQFFISRYYGTVAFADYSNGCLNIPFAIMITSSVKNVLLPLLSKADATGELQTAFKTYQNAVNKSIILIFPLLVLCFVSTEDIMVFLYGSQYSSSSIYMKSYIIREFTHVLPYFSVLMATGLSNKYMTMHIWGAIYIWVAGFVITQLELDAFIIVLAHSLFYFFCSIYAFICIYNKTKFKLINFDILKVIIAVLSHSAICGFIALQFNYHIYHSEIPIINLVIMSCVFYATLISTGKLLHINYLESITRIIKKKI
ncbi:MAG: oligosaccharide flippase family protein [Bacteroidaceae bacterium]|nr:oligosaccharide flippase family protein [Bacteroidaceae bacterium]